jgi:hypothetical protein
VNQKTSISVQAAARELAREPLSSLQEKRRLVAVHLTHLRATAKVVSFNEYRKLFHVAMALDGVIDARAKATPPANPKPRPPRPRPPFTIVPGGKA